MKVLDGDKIMALLSLFIKDCLDEIKLNEEINVIHTGYSNGGLLEFLDKKYIKTHCVPTGIKYVKNEAKKYNISI